MKLHEITGKDDWLWGEEAEAWCSEYLRFIGGGVRNGYNDHSGIMIDGDVEFKAYIAANFRVKIRKIDGDLSVSMLKGQILCKSFNTFPEEVTGGIELGYTNFSSLKGISKCNEISAFATNITDIAEVFPGMKRDMNYMDITSNDITSLVGIADHFKFSLKRLDFTGDTVKEGGLGLILVPDLQKMHFSDDEGETSQWSIIASYLGKGEGGLIECQSALIEAGFEDFAVL